MHSSLLLAFKWELSRSQTWKQSCLSKIKAEGRTINVSKLQKNWYTLLYRRTAEDHIRCHSGHRSSTWYCPCTTHLPSLINWSASYFSVFSSFFSPIHVQLFLVLKALFPAYWCQTLHACPCFFPLPIKTHITGTSPHNKDRNARNIKVSSFQFKYCCQRSTYIYPPFPDTAFSTAQLVTIHIVHGKEY